MIIVSGGLCPGINPVIRELYMCLTKNYLVEKVYGAEFGYKGMYSAELREFNDEMLESVHKQGGCFIGCKRSDFD